MSIMHMNQTCTCNELELLHAWYISMSHSDFVYDNYCLFLFISKTKVFKQYIACYNTSFTQVTCQLLILNSMRYLI